MSGPRPSETDTTFWSLYMPKLVTCLGDGYGLDSLRRDLVAGFTVSVVALPLAMALAIASGTTPDRGLYTAVVAGFLISLLGGSRLQVGGPTGAFVVVVFNVIEQHGLDGLLLATMMAGIILIALGLARLGTIIKYMPYPVVTGFTSGIAVIIFASQIRDLLGLDADDLPGDFIDKLVVLGRALPTMDPVTLILSLGTLAIIVALRRFRPKLPNFIIAVAVASVVVWALGLDTATIGSRFGGIPQSLPQPSLPDVSLQRIQDLFPAAFTIALLGGIESLLSAVIADGIAGTRHRSNCELVAQGVANVVSPLFGGLPATGAIARTVTNVNSGGRTPVAGMLHAVFLLVFMLLLAPLAAWVPLASLAAVLTIVAWNMSEVDRFATLLRAPMGDRLVLITTFALTVLVDITVAVQVGVVLAALMFMQRMSRAGEVQGIGPLFDRDVADSASRAQEGRLLTFDTDLPDGVAIYRINGPFFFGTSWRLDDALDRLGMVPRVFILDMARVPFIDATGAHSLIEFVRRVHQRGATVIFAAAGVASRRQIRQMGLVQRDRKVRFAPSLQRAIELTKPRG